MKRVVWNLFLVLGVAMSSLYGEWNVSKITNEYDKNLTIKDNVTELENNVSFVFPLYRIPIVIDEKSIIDKFFKGAETDVKQAGRFNVVDVTFNSDSNPIDKNNSKNNLYTQTVGNRFNIKLVHLSDDNKTLTELNNTEIPFVLLELMDNKTGKIVEKFMPPVPFFKRKSVTISVRVNKAYRDVKFIVIHQEKDGIKRYYSRDNFAIKPIFKISFPDSIKDKEGKYKVKQNHKIPMDIKVVDFNGNIMVGEKVVPDYNNSSDNLNFKVESITGKRVYPLMYDFRIVNSVMNEKYIKYTAVDILKFTLSEKVNDKEFAKVDEKDVKNGGTDNYERLLIKGISPVITIYKSYSQFYAGKGTDESENSPYKKSYISEIKSKTDRVYHKVAW